MGRLIEIFTSGCFIPDLQSTTKREAIQELVDVLVREGRLAKGRAPAALKALMAREELGSTGVGRGVAVPHATQKELTRVVGAIGLSKKGVDFRSLDGKPVDLVFLILSPPDSPDRLEALRLVSEFVMEQDLCRFLRQAPDAKAVQDLLEEAETRL